MLRQTVGLIHFKSTTREKEKLQTDRNIRATLSSHVLCESDISSTKLLLSRSPSALLAATDPLLPLSIIWFVSFVRRFGLLLERLGAMWRRRVNPNARRFADSSSLSVATSLHQISRSSPLLSIRLILVWEDIHHSTEFML
ncbi:uncharacterized protein LOC105421477 isoform X2 [Amborella trichopoda]|uniref:uncharacterized protein LOC105421477 isoform X2 n=1 Tax=Amborella trichopoda TaxID=13333 RepID=UPI0009BE4EBD|nr:uncharacterized protein LOC105421477 isoform X2 [Amborella trichopoda]|eukprot:XP_020529506.1 uncharacterized protein LOC105421477 isoform X2 [Amborella trichopoda]